MKSKIVKAAIGLVLGFIVHLPRLVYHILLLSCAAVFNNRPTLTASPAEHLRRAKKILKRGRLSELLYAGVEIRFALERIAQRDLLLTELASERILKEYDPSKKLANLYRIAPEAAYAHDIFLLNKKTGERFKWGEYKPLDRERVTAIKGRLGDLLHPKDGLQLGISDDPWYKETTRFLNEAVEYLSMVYRDNSPFFAYEGLENFEMLRGWVMPEQYESGGIINGINQASRTSILPVTAAEMSAVRYSLRRSIASDTISTSP